MDKQVLRKLLIVRRKNFPPVEREKADVTIFRSIVSLPPWQRAKIICVYRSLPTEVDTKKLILSTHKHFVYPENIKQEKIDLYIVPGVAFDRQCNRLGRGKGHYDRLLTDVKVTKIGLAYSFQVLAQVPHTSYDVPMDMVVTDKEVIICRT